MSRRFEKSATFGPGGGGCEGVESGDDVIMSDLQSRWLGLCRSLGVADSGRVWNHLDDGYGSNTRHYHNWQHIAQCLQWFDALREYANSPVVIELAIWFHDVIYDSKRPDNESRSAALLSSLIEETFLTEGAARLIAATTHKDPPEDNDAALLCDIDLSILASDEQRYTDYSRAVRLEYDWVSDADFRVGRANVLRAFLGRPFIYSLPVCRGKWEMLARENITQELAVLE